TILITCRDITGRKIVEEKLQRSARLNELVLDSLPHPALLISKDRVVFAANKIAKEIGAVVGGICWRDFGHSTYLSKAHRNTIAKTTKLAGCGAHCTFCLADEGLDEKKSIKKPAVKAYGQILDIYWVPIGEDVYLHYSIDITEQKKAEKKMEDAYKIQHNIASTLQKSLISSDIPKIKSLEVKFMYKSATKGAEVGGDFFDIFETPNNNFGIVMGDVSGKGVDAAAETAKIKYLLRDRAYTNLGPTELLSSINDTLFKQGADRFTALTYGVYDPQTSTFTLTNAGNPYPYEAGKDRFLKITGVPVSVQENAIYSSLKLKLKEDDVIIMFTDGLTEARCDGDFFGEQRVRDFVKKNKHLSLKQLLSGLIKEANNFAQKKLNDDILIVGIKKL
ncbi:MAG TPA: hypothetical protein ENH57_01415, partial [Actinobacteria bacterium]|nr:hypothetical protein [Actinomycetota bacterium]